MKFNKILIPSSITGERGIHNLNLSRLGNVVAFVGKNGSGKTRILDILEQHLFKTTKMSWFKNGDIELDDNNVSLKKFRQAAHPYWDMIFYKEGDQELLEKIGSDPSPSSKEELINFRRKNILNHTKLVYFDGIEAHFKKLLGDLEQRYLRRIKYSEIQQLQTAINSEKVDEALSFESLVENITQNNYNEFSSIHKTGLRYLNKLPHQLMHDYMEAFGDQDTFEKKVAYRRYISLKKLVKDFLNKDLTWSKKSTSSVVTEKGVQANYSGIWHLDKREFNYKEFSDGEKTLFAYALLFFLIEVNPGLNIKNSVVLIDEPELHLHPNAEIDLINGIRKAIGENGQLIFTTHSINILSHLNFEEIFMVKDGHITHPSRTTIGNTLSELMGLEDRITKLSEFLSSIAVWTFVNFMAECFSDPEVIRSSNSNDPQLLAFKRAVNENITKNHNALLDFGAGKGRLFEQLKSDYDFMEKINYSALEPEKNFHQLLENLGAKNIYKSHSELPKNTFDFILLCNVLHEIPILEWVSTLNSTIESLNNTGYLIIIEAKVLTKGEKIGEEGFILLDIEEIKSLFNLKKNPLSIEIPGKENLITCVAIDKKQLSVIDNDSLLRTLQILKQNTLKKIINLRKEAEKEGTNLVGFGRKNAFLSQLHINSQIAEMKMIEAIGQG